MPDDDRSTAALPRRSLGWRSLDTAAAASWRLLLVAAAVWVALQMLARVWVVVFPVIGAFIVCVGLWPVRSWLVRRRVPQLAATWIAFVLPFAVIAGIVALVLPAVREQFVGLDDTVEESVEDLREWATGAPLHLDRGQVDDISDTVSAEVRKFASGPRLGTLTRAVIEVAAGVLLALVVLFFFLKDGERLREWALTRAPARRQDEARRLAEAGWRALRGYLRGTLLIGGVEALFVLVLLLIVGVPLVVPLAIMTLLGAFFPLVGAVVAGLLTVLVTLTTQGPTAAIVVGVAVVVLQQVDGDILQPLLMGNAVQMHPIVILVALAAGGVIGGLAGAFLAVPTAAVVVAISREWRRSRDLEVLDKGTPLLEP